MTKAYYKTTHPEVRAALDQRNEAVDALRKRGEAFEKLLGANHMIVQNSTAGYRVIGYNFEPAKDDRLWTKPDHERLREQHPRQSIKKATPEEKAELARLRDLWKEHFPAGSVEFDPVLQAMGTTWGALIFGGSFAMLDRDDAIYVATTAELNDRMVEIMASEYLAAEEKKS